MREQVVYTKRIIAYIDILGFKEHVRKSINNENEADKLLQVMKFIEGTSWKSPEDDSSGDRIGREVTVFSSSAVISYSMDFQGAVFLALMDLIRIQMEMIFQGILFRGGVSVGEMYHDFNTVFGPGVLEAYNLKAANAVYPRILITKETILEGISHNREQNSYDMEMEYVLSLLRYDKDGFYYIDYLRKYEELNFREDYYMMIGRVRGLIINELANQSDKKILKKYRWLREYYNSTVDTMNLKPKREWKIASQLGQESLKHSSSSGVAEELG